MKSKAWVLPWPLAFAEALLAQEHLGVSGKACAADDEPTHAPKVPFLTRSTSYQFIIWQRRE